MDKRWKKTFGIRRDDTTYYDRPGAYLLMVKDGKLALVRTHKGYFLIGGGKLPGESLEDCLQRECREEIGCPVKIKRFLGTAEAYMYYEKFGDFHPIQSYYEGEILPQTQSPVEKDHVFEWIPLSRAAESMYLELQAWVVEEYVRQCCS